MSDQIYVGVAALDRLALQRRIDAIGTTRHEATHDDTA